MASTGHIPYCRQHPDENGGLFMPSKIIDQASKVEDMQRKQTIAVHRIDRNAVSATHCIECDDPLPEAWRTTYPGYTTCVNWQKE